MKKIATVMMIAAAIFIAGCSEQSDTSKKSQAGNQKPKTVVVNEGMSKEEEDKLNERLADLEDKVNDQSSEEPAQETESAEDPARAAAQAYYAAAATGNYSYTGLAQEVAPAQKVGTLHKKSQLGVEGIVALGGWDAKVSYQSRESVSRDKQGTGWRGVGLR